MPVVGFLSNLNTGAGTGSGKITAHGPILHYVTSRQPGTDDLKIQKFAGLHINVKKGEYLGIRAKSTSILRCDSGSKRQLLFQPPLVVGAAPVAANGNSTCALLIEAVMDPA